GDVFKFGAGATYDDLALREMDFSTPGFDLDSIRVYRAFAPGAWAYGHVRWVFSISYVRVQQNPDRDYLYDNRAHITNRTPIGNPALEPATAISYQAAVKHLLSPRWSMQTSVFFRDLFGLVGARNQQPELDIPRLMYENSDDAHANGVEATLLWSSSAGSHAELNYTFLEARGTQSRESGVPFGPKLQARAETIGQHALDWD